MALFRQAARRLHVQRLVAQRTFASVTKPSMTGAIGTWYNTFGKSTAGYASWLIMLIVVGEYATGTFTEKMWQLNNKGKTFTTYDWSKFDKFGDDDDDEEEEEEEEDDE
ncbi:hypothetical protein FisN_6Lh114 [Fistulifera solaris]|uniref:Uncharacterized protein n=1 Tax=Fistulifera solaris TaxID=1519565 RepID=A0A1Z5J6Q2_FISSO|nr:hypothetical protein FisN_6Lh114 [Fistulifera solaris]|eukprot:GAX09498.1 hypothetical protein FisN_6Lh114 [Fistulifera solaris]